MEAIKCEIGGSEVTLTDEGMTISIPRSHWSKKQWEWIVRVVTQLIIAGLSWITAPSAIEAVPGSEGEAGPRWKKMRVDGLSRLLYALMIGDKHPLRRLYDAFDWGQIDRLGASEYKNGGKGAPAWPPQVLFRIIVLMFYSGTPFESATLRRLQTDVVWRWFVGLSLLWKVPDAGTLSYFRSRLGREKFEAILIKVIEACDEAGLIGHQESYYDMTGVEARATQVTPYQRAVILAKAMSAWLNKEQGGIGKVSQEEIAAIALEVLQEQHPSLKKVKAEQIVASQKKMEDKPAKTLKGEPKWWQRLGEKNKRIGGTDDRVGGFKDRGLTRVSPPVSAQPAPGLWQSRCSRRAHPYQRDNMRLSQRVFGGRQTLGHHSACICGAQQTGSAHRPHGFGQALQHFPALSQPSGA